MNLFANVKTILNPFGNDFTMYRGVFVMLLVVVIMSFLIYWIVQSILLGKIFKKAGIAQWKAWVPVYNVWKIFQLGGYHGGWSLLMPIVVAAIVCFWIVAGSCDKWENAQLHMVIASIFIFFVALIFFIIKYLLATWNITKKLDKNLVYMLLLFVHIGPSLWLWILALDRSKWNDKLGNKSLAPEMRKKSSKK